ncbi:unnamed protein product [Moneuplotes crassus]|uniref:Uncharacterized protein n=1 Tax=Euplotes crassus TaxID=5936 RepID=A0AAD1XSE2_EUPCR|nr:unnamed protein product [Moneuplotes crassus]
MSLSTTEEKETHFCERYFFESLHYIQENKKLAASGSHGYKSKIELCYNNKLPGSWKPLRITSLPESYFPHIVFRVDKELSKKHDYDFLLNMDLSGKKSLSILNFTNEKKVKVTLIYRPLLKICSKLLQKVVLCRLVLTGRQFNNIFLSLLNTLEFIFFMCRIGTKNVCVPINMKTLSESITFDSCSSPENSILSFGDPEVDNILNFLTSESLLKSLKTAKMKIIITLEQVCAFQDAHPETGNTVFNFQNQTTYQNYSTSAK